MPPAALQTRTQILTPNPNPLKDPHSLPPPPHPHHTNTLKRAQHHYVDRLRLFRFMDRLRRVLGVGLVGLLKLMDLSDDPVAALWGSGRVFSILDSPSVAFRSCSFVVVVGGCCQNSQGRPLFLDVIVNVADFRALIIPLSYVVQLTFPPHFLCPPPPLSSFTSLSFHRHRFGTLTIV